MRWKIATIALAVVLVAAIGLGQWQLSSERHRAFNSELQLFVLMRKNQVASDQSASTLKTQIGNVLAESLGTTLGGVDGLKNVIGTYPIGNSLTGAVSNLQREVSCLETDITDIENQSTTYLQCN